MMRDWRTALLAHVAKGPVVMVTVIGTDGSTPREVGARMLVHANGSDGSIGGGRLEYQECAAARALLDNVHRDWVRETRRIVLGPDAGQCCGGVVEVLHEVIRSPDAHVFAARGWVERPIDINDPVRRITSDESREFVSDLRIEHRDGIRWLIEPTAPERTPLYLYGAGHVARALVHILRELPFDVHWVDIEATRFPDARGEERHIISATPAEVARHAHGGAIHLVMTHTHDIDADICEALLRRGNFAWLGLIGSKTKRARFVQRFGRTGLDDAVLRRLICPIGHPDVPGKAPATIAISVAAQLLATGLDRGDRNRGGTDPEYNNAR